MQSSNDGYFAHPDCILLCMIVDHDVNKRKEACLRIIKARKSEDSSPRRKFRLPEINFLAEDYSDMKTWKSAFSQKAEKIRYRRNNSDYNCLKIEYMPNPTTKKSFQVKWKLNCTHESE